MNSLWLLEPKETAMTTFSESRKNLLLIKAELWKLQARDANPLEKSLLLEKASLASLQAEQIECLHAS